MKPLCVIFLLFLTEISFSESKDEAFPLRLSFSEFAKDKSVFSPNNLQKLYEKLESLEEVSISKNGIITQNSVSAIVNEFVDELLAEVQNYLIEQELDGIDLPDISLSFSYKPLWITYSGSLTLTYGNCVNLASIQRTGDVVATYQNKYLNIDVTLGFQSLRINYDYVAKIMSIGPSGTVYGDTESTEFSFAMGLNFNNYSVELNSFTVEDIGEFSLDFSGNSLFDWLLEILSNLIVPFFKENIQNVIEKNVYSIITQLVELLNEKIQDILSGIMN